MFLHYLIVLSILAGQDKREGYVDYDVDDKDFISVKKGDVIGW